MFDNVHKLVVTSYNKIVFQSNVEHDTNDCIWLHYITLFLL